MNQTFSSARFGRLLRKFWHDNQRELLMQAAALFVVMLVGMLFLCYSSTPDSAEHSRVVALLLISLVACPLFTVHVTSVYNKREQAISALLLPVSLFEKWLLLWVVTGLVFALCFLGFFHLIDAIGTYYVNHRDWSEISLKYLRDNALPMTMDYFAYNDLYNSPIWAVWVFLHPFTLMAGLLFRRYTLVIGVLTGITLFATVLFGNIYLTRVMLGHTGPIASGFPYAGVTVFEKVASATGHDLNLPQPIGNIIRWTVGLVVFALLYAIAFFRLKEREV